MEIFKCMHFSFVGYGFFVTFVMHVYEMLQHRLPNCLDTLCWGRSRPIHNKGLFRLMVGMSRSKILGPLGISIPTHAKQEDGPNIQRGLHHLSKSRPITFTCVYLFMFNDGHALFVGLKTLTQDEYTI